MFKQTLMANRVSLSSLPSRISLVLPSLVSLFLMGFLMLAAFAISNGFDSMLQNSGSDANVIFLQKGSANETSSFIGRDERRLLLSAQFFSRDENGQALASYEPIVIFSAVDRESGSTSNALFRGVSLDNRDIRTQMELVEGRWFQPDSSEIVVGANVSDRYQNLDVENTIEIGSCAWNVVGVFRSGSTLDSEVLAHNRRVDGCFDRNGVSQSVIARLSDPREIFALRSFVNQEPRLNLEVLSERVYFNELSQQTRLLIRFIGIPIIAIALIGAFFSNLNCMYHSVYSRNKETNVLRVLGFDFTPIASSTLIENLLVSIAAVLLAVAVGILALHGNQTSMIGSNFSQVEVILELRSSDFARTAVYCTAVGLLSAIVTILVQYREVKA